MIKDVKVRDFIRTLRQYTEVRIYLMKGNVIEEYLQHSADRWFLKPLISDSEELRNHYEEILNSNIIDVEFSDETFILYTTLI